MGTFSIFFLFVAKQRERKRWQKKEKHAIEMTEWAGDTPATPLKPAAPAPRRDYRRGKRLQASACNGTDVRPSGLEQSEGLQVL